jgi:hypothetical protein
MPGLVPGIHVFCASKTWMAGTTPAVTKSGGSGLPENRPNLLRHSPSTVVAAML